jgi:hypothetical protein
MKTHEELMMFMRTRQFAVDVLALVESVVGDNFKSLRRLEPSIKTINDYVQHVEEDKVQQTVYLTVRAAYEFEYAIKRVLSDAGFDTVAKTHNNEEQKNDFGVSIAGRVDPIYFEVKTTQSDNGWTGATHSEGSGKVDNYVLVSYNVDRDMELPSLDTSAIHGLFKSVHFSVIDGLEVAWSGGATDKSSFTKAKVPVEKEREYSKQIVLGSVIPKRVWCEIIRESLEEMRDKSGKLITGGNNVRIAA